jgi:hypothetical protein
MRNNPCVLSGALTLMLFSGGGQAVESTLLERAVHLGVQGFPEWKHFEDSAPHGRQLDLKFKGQPNPDEATLFIRQQDVKYPWSVKLNGKSIGALDNMEVELLTPFRIPPGLLRDGENLLSIVPPKSTDDILVGEIILDSQPLRRSLNRCSVSVVVTEALNAEHRPVPCRITIADERGALVPVHTNPDSTLPTGRGVIETKPGQRLAVRTGVVYTPDGSANFGLRPGKYTIYASRGFEYSAATNHVDLTAGDSLDLKLEIRREVPTEGWVAADCHIHNLTYSGHGDATIDEGMVTIAGEGIEFAVATDHNHHTDYRETVRKLALSDRFTSVVGNEVTTKTGHFNAFPIASGSSLPDHKLTDWTALLKSIRERTRSKVIVLNHPRNVHSGFSPVDPQHFRQATGENLRGAPFGFEAMEIVTSAALQSDYMDPIRDWFGLLNFGLRITGVGSSDTHYVSRMILGQGRSYVRADDRDPADLSIEQLVEGYRDGRVSVSMGLFVDARVGARPSDPNTNFGMGDLATGLGPDAHFTVTATGPSWIQPTRDSPTKIQIFMNGFSELSYSILPGNPTDLTKGSAGFVLRDLKEAPKHDYWIVAVVTAPGVTAPFWAIPRPYQPSSRTWTPKVIGVANPIYIDGDGDGKYTSPRDYAKKLYRKHKDDLRALFKGLRDYDQAVAIQAASLLQANDVDLDSSVIKRLLSRASPTIRRGFSTFLEAIN